MRMLLILVTLGAVSALGGTDEVLSPFRRASLDDQGLGRLPLEKLEKLVLRGQLGYGPDSVTDAGITQLKRAGRLRVLHAGGLRLTDKALETIGKLTNLEELHLDSNQITGVGLKHLTGLKKLRVLNIDLNQGFDPAAFATLAELTTLQKLYVSGQFTVDDRVLHHCSKLEHLTELRLPERTPAVTDVGLAHLARLTKLKNVVLSDTPHVTDAGLAHLRALDRLESLQLATLPKLSPSGLEILDSFPEMRRLHLGAVKINAAALNAVASMKQLERLHLWNLNGAVPSLEVLGKLTSLKTLRTNEPLDSATLRALTNNRHLESIGDELRLITDEDLKVIAQLPKLRILILDSEQITAESLPTLHKMQSLQELYVTDKVKITPEQWRLLGESGLNQCKIGRYFPPYTVYHQPPTN